MHMTRRGQLQSWRQGQHAGLQLKIQEVDEESNEEHIEEQDDDPVPFAGGGGQHTTRTTHSNPAGRG